MTRVIQPQGTKGSLKWMQQLVAHQPTLLNEAIRSAGGLLADESVNWVSPCDDDNFAEYRDGDFLGKVGLAQLRCHLADFWPRGGPQWDGLGIGGDGTVLLVEAKAHLAELTSTCQASPDSKKRIHAALESTKAYLGASEKADWLVDFYQYANRLAHLHFLKQHGVKAALVFIYFMNDHDMRGPTSEMQWKAGLDTVAAQLGLPADYKKCGVIDVFIDVGSLLAAQ